MESGTDARALLDFVNVTRSDDDELAELIRRFTATHPIQSWKTYGFFDEAYLELINPHWLVYDPAPAFTHHLFATLYLLIMLVGCCGNILVIFMFLKCRSLRTPANYLILNLAMSDFLMLSKTPIMVYNTILEGPALGSIGCKIYGFVGGLSGTASIMTLTTIALDRYFVIMHPLNPLKKATHRKAIGMIIIIWAYAAFFSAFPLFGLNNYVSEGYLTTCSFDYLATDMSSRVFIFVFFLAAWLLPLLVISFSYVSIFSVVFQAERLELLKDGRSASKQSSKNRRRQEKLGREVKIARVASMIIGMWVLAWTPYAVVALLGISGLAHLITPLVSAIPALFCKTASCVDPFIYAITHPRFKRELSIRFRIAFPNSRRPPSMSTHSHHKQNIETSVSNESEQTNYGFANHSNPEDSEGLVEIPRTPSTRSTVLRSILASPRRTSIKIVNHEAAETSLAEVTPKSSKSPRRRQSEELSSDHISCDFVPSVETIV